MPRTGADSIRFDSLTISQILDSASFQDYWEDYASKVLINLADRSTFDVTVPVALTKNADPTKTHLLSASVMFDTFGLPLVVSAVLTPLSIEYKSRTEPSMVIQVGGSSRNPTVRPVSLQSLEYLWMC